MFYQGLPVAHRLSAPITYSLADDLTHVEQEPEDESLRCLTWSLAYKSPVDSWVPPQSVCNYDVMHSVVHRYILLPWYLLILIIALILYLSTARILRYTINNTMDWMWHKGSS